MALPSGVTSETQAYDDLIAGEVVILGLTVDSAATVEKGQVYEYDPSAQNWVNIKTAGVGKGPYAVCTETRTIVADSKVSCIVGGKVRRAALNAGSLAKVDLDADLILSGIYPIASGLI